MRYATLGAMTCSRTVGSLDAYQLLAAEYDQPEHRTTRVLETLSCRALAKVRECALAGNLDRVLEIGAGTGALTTALFSTWPKARVLSTDPSSEMLMILDAKFDGASAQLRTVLADATQVNEVCDFTPDLIAAGLADPFLDGDALAAFRILSAPESRLFVSVPSHRWASRERHDRLGVAVDVTRFRTNSGSVVFARSLAYDEPDLRTLLLDAGFVPIAMGTERSRATWTQPEVCWALAMPV